MYQALSKLVSFLISLSATNAQTCRFMTKDAILFCYILRKTSCCWQNSFSKKVFSMHYERHSFGAFFVCKKHTQTKTQKRTPKMQLARLRVRFSAKTRTKLKN